MQELEKDLLTADRSNLRKGNANIRQQGTVAGLTREVAEKETRILELESQLAQNQENPVRSSQDATRAPQTAALHQELLELRAARQLDSVTLDQVRFSI